ncbi:hypothetical protein CLOM_g24053, partial [Closterium sp. NIES-68]
MMAPESPSPLYLFYNPPLGSECLSRSCRNSLPSQPSVQAPAMTPLTTSSSICAYAHAALPPHDFHDHRQSAFPHGHPPAESVAPHLAPRESVSPLPDPPEPRIEPQSAVLNLDPAPPLMEPAGVHTPFDSFAVESDGHLFTDVDYGLGSLDDAFHGLETFTDLCDLPGPTAEACVVPDGAAVENTMAAACETLGENSSQHVSCHQHVPPEAAAPPALAPNLAPSNLSTPPLPAQQQDGWMALLAADLGLAAEEAPAEGCADAGMRLSSGAGAFQAEADVALHVGGQAEADAGEAGGVVWGGVAEERAVGGETHVFQQQQQEHQQPPLFSAWGADVVSSKGRSSASAAEFAQAQLQQQQQQQQQQQSHESSVGWQGSSLDGSKLNSSSLNGGSSSLVCCSASDDEAVQAMVEGEEVGGDAEELQYGQDKLQQQFYHYQGQQQQQQQQLVLQQRQNQYSLLHYPSARGVSPSPPADEPAFPRWISAPAIPAHSSACPCGRCAPSAHAGKSPARSHSALISGARGVSGRAGAGAVASGAAGHFAPKLGAVSVGRISPPKKRQQVLVVASASANPGRRPGDLSQRLAAVIDRIAAGNAPADGGGGVASSPRVALLLDSEGPSLPATGVATGSVAAGAGALTGAAASALSLWDRVRREGLSRSNGSGTVSASPAPLAVASALNADEGANLLPVSGSSPDALQRAAEGGFRTGVAGGERERQLVLGRGPGAGAGAASQYARKGAVKGGNGGRGGALQPDGPDGGAGVLEPIAFTDSGKRALSRDGKASGSRRIGDDEEELAHADAYSSGHGYALADSATGNKAVGFFHSSSTSNGSRGSGGTSDSNNTTTNNNNNNNNNSSDSSLASGSQSRALALPARRYLSSLSYGARTLYPDATTAATTDSGSPLPPPLPQLPEGQQATVPTSSALALLPSASHLGMSESDLFLRLAAGARTAAHPPALPSPSVSASLSPSSLPSNGFAHPVSFTMHTSACSAYYTASSPTSLHITVPSVTIPKPLFPEPVFVGCPVEARATEAVVSEAAGMWRHDSSLAPVSATARLRTVDQLTALAEAYATDDQTKIRFLNRKLTKKADPMGDPLQRTVHFFLEALTARQEGRGLELFRRPVDTPLEEVSQAMMLLCRAVPFVHTCRTVIYEAVLHALATEPVCTHLHLISFGMLPGNNWVEVLHSLLHLPSGAPPRITLTGIDAPTTPGKIAMKAAMGDFGQKLEAMAAALGLNFTYRAAGVGMEALRPGMMQREGEPGEVVVVACAMHMQFLPDVSVVRANQRDTVLRVVHSLRPAAFALIDVDANFNSPFFLSRFREAAMYYTNLLLCVDAAGMSRTSPRRVLFESCYLARDIVNVIACEGLDRMVRPERMEQWQARLERLGFFPRAVPPDLVQKILVLPAFRMG